MKRKYLIIIMLPFLLSSCNKWLDINPELEIRNGDMYATQQGFMDVLTGAYIRMATPTLYGCNLTVRLPELMANHWTTVAGTVEDYIASFDFTQTSSKELLETIWLQYYQTIVNLNALLEEIETKEDIFTDGNYELIKGEALGLRAFLHFEILRYWGVVPQNMNMSERAIPYVTTVTKNPNELLSQNYQEVCDKILNDLNEAEKLLANDPILLYNNDALNYPEYEGTTAAQDAYPSSDFHFYRQMKFNYYAVKATKARYYMWLGDVNMAANYAMEVINAQNADGSSKFSLADESEAALGEMTFPTEHIFAVYNSEATNTLNSYFFNYTTMYTQNMSYLETAYETSLHTSDIRFRENRLWEERYVPLVSNPQNYFKKYWDTETSAVEQIPLIRLSEMYFIAIEGGNVELFRTYRIARNLDSSIDGTLTDKESIMNRLELEYRKEFYGEGQMYFFYKRLGYTNYSWPTTKVVDLSSYQLPIPEMQENFEQPANEVI